MAEPSNKNFYSSLGFVFLINRTPNLNFFVQSVDLPGITMNEVNIPTPFKKIPIAGDTVEFGTLDVTFKISEDFSNYREIFNWITALGFPDNHLQYKTLADKLPGDGTGLMSDATLMIISSAKNPIVRIEILDLFPISLSPVTVDLKSGSVQYLDTTASFKFLNYKFVDV